MSRRYIFAVLTSVALAISGVAVADGPPPRDLHVVGDHWTAWNPPTDFSESNQVHIIQPGDTLWDLAARFQGDPYLWPQIWELNQYILDAHWIYPGDPLVVGVKVVTPSELEQMTSETVVGEGIIDPGPAEVDTSGFGKLPPSSGAPRALGFAADLYCSGFIGDGTEEFGYRIIGSEYDVASPALADLRRPVEDGVYGVAETARYGLSTGDIVYIDGGRAAGLFPGQLFTAVEPGQTVSHPLTRKRLGRHYRHLGRVRILSVQEETAIAEVTGDVCAPVVVGAWLEPFEEEPVPLGRPGILHPVNFPTKWSELESAPMIVYSEDGVITLGEHAVVFIDRGDSPEELVPGDLYTIYRKNRGAAPPVVIGELAVLSVRRGIAIGRILETRFPVYLGDRLDLK
jgi:LysM repeat protein